MLQKLNPDVTVNDLTRRVMSMKKFRKKKPNTIYQFIKRNVKVQENKERKERQRVKRTENNVMLVRNLLEQNIREIKSKMNNYF